MPPLSKDQYYTLRLPKLKNYQSFDSLFVLLKDKKIEDFLVVDHIVKKGDNLSRIAFKYNIKIQDITSMNNISQRKYLQPGQVLQIPTQGYDEYMKSLISSSSSTKIHHTVRAGDTLGEIASRYKTSIKKIKKWNGIRENDNLIYVGKKIIIHTSSKNLEKINNYSIRRVNYKVRYGDSLSKISYKFGVRVSDIKKWNRLKNDLIKVGQILIINTKY